MGRVYLIHFDTPLWSENPRGQARHYLGYASKSLKSRLEQHAAGTGAAIMRTLKEKGITWRVVRTWKGNRQLERKLKNWHNAPMLCPVCNKAKENSWIRQ